MTEGLSADDDKDCMATARTPVGAPVKEVTLTQLHNHTGRLINEHEDGGKLAIRNHYGRIIAVLVCGPEARELIAEPANAA